MRATSPEPDSGKAPGGSLPGSATPGGASGSFFFIVAGLLLLAGPRAMRRQRHASVLRRLAPLLLIPTPPG
jgi:hypothetical protein